MPPIGLRERPLLAKCDPALAPTFVQVQALGAYARSSFRATRASKTRRVLASNMRSQLSKTIFGLCIQYSGTGSCIDSSRGELS